MLKKQVHRGLFGRFVLSFMLFAWANAYAGPCLMAMNDAAASGQTAHAGHDGHGSGGHAAHEETAPDCDHCPPGGHDTARCESGLSADCGVVPEFGAEFRKAESKFKDLSAVASLSWPAVVSLYRYARVQPPPDLSSLLKWRADPPLFIQHDAYLK